MQCVCRFMDWGCQVSWTSSQHAPSAGISHIAINIASKCLSCQPLFLLVNSSSFEQVFVANHTSMIDFIILEQMAAFAVIMQKHPGWVGKNNYF